jgi:hypothetical protein
MKAFIFTLLLAAPSFAQAPKAEAAPPVTPVILVKDTPASKALISAAKDAAETQKNFDNALLQAKSGLDVSQKNLSSSLDAKTKDLHDKLLSDKKYAEAVKEIDTIQNQIQNLSKTANTKFQEQSGPLQQKIATDTALINGLIPVVRQENELKATDVFDAATQAWHPAPGTK